MRVGDVFEVGLEGVPTAGYVWEVAVEGRPPGLVEPAGRETRPPGPGVAGGRATQVFRFRALLPGEGALRFRYGRPWERAPVRERTVTVRVQPGPAEG